MAYDLETMVAFFEMSPDGLVITDEKGRASQLNPSFESILGYSRDDILGSYVWEIMSMVLPEDEKARLAPSIGKEALLEQLGGGPEAKDNLLITARAHRHDGKRIWIEAYRMVLENGGRRRLAFLVRNITERKELELRNKALYDKQRTVFETTGTGAMIIEEDGRISMVNSSFAKQVGLAKEEIEWHMSFKDFVHPSDLDRVAGYHRLRRMDESAVPSEYEIKFLDKSGKVHNAVLNVSMIPGTRQSMASVMDITEIREAYEALVRLQQRTRETLDSIGDAFFSLDERCLVTYFNDAAERIFRCKRKDVLGVGIAKALPGLRGSELEERIKQAMMHRTPQQFETNYALGEGSEWFDVRIYPQDRGLSVFIQVSTGRKLMEEQLRERTEEVDRFFTSSIDLLAIADTEGYFRRLNPEWEAALGYSLEEMLDHRFMDFVHPEDIAITIQATSTLASGKKVQSFTNRYRAKDGGYRYIEWRSVPYGNIIYAAARDITFRKQAEEALRESESKYRALVENAQEGIWAADQNWMTVFVNQRMAAMLGYRPEEIIGRPVVDFLDEKARKRFEEHKPLSQEGAKERYDFEIVRKDGRRIFVTVHISPLMVGDEFHGLLAMVSDITERKMMENALKEANGKLNLLNSLTRHDLNNQLVVMRGHLVLAEKGTHSENLRSHLHKALKASDNINRLLEFSRDYQGLGKDAPLWLNLQEVCTLGLTSVDLGHIAVDLDLGDFEVFADKMLEKVFHNLASNSIMHGERTSRISVSCQEQGSTLVITYVDDGVGIPYERKSEILGPNQGYHGLNLAKGVLEMTGIAISECGVPGEGARFVITIPSQSYRRPKAKVR